MSIGYRGIICSRFVVDRIVAINEAAKERTLHHAPCALPGALSYCGDSVSNDYDVVHLAIKSATRSC